MIVYVRTDGGSDLHGDGSHERPFASEERAREAFPGAYIFVDDVVRNDLPLRSDSSTIVVAALMAGALASVAFGVGVGLLVGGATAVGLSAIERRFS